jgi:hypothetical protein
MERQLIQQEGHKIMRLKIDTSEVRFRVAGSVKRKQVKGQDATTPDGRPVWTVRLDAIEDGKERRETIWVEVAGEEPKLTFEGAANVTDLTFAPWVNRDGKIVRNFRAEQVTAADAAVRRAA